MEIKHNVHQIEMGFVNVYLLIDADGLVLVDTGMGPSAKKITAYIRSLGRQPEELKAVLLTHGDPDHIGGLNKLRAVYPFAVYASQLAAESLARGQASRQLNLGALGMAMMRGLEKLMPSGIVQVDHVAADGEMLPFVGGVQVVVTPGHTPGHLSFYCVNQKVLLAGDSMRSRSGSLVAGDFKVITWDRDALFASIEKQSQLGAEVVGVGHGPLARVASAGDFPKP